MLCYSNFSVSKVTLRKINLLDSAFLDFDQDLPPDFMFDMP